MHQKSKTEKTGNTCCKTMAECIEQAYALLLESRAIIIHNLSTQLLAVKLQCVIPFILYSLKYITILNCGHSLPTPALVQCEHT